MRKTQQGARDSTRALAQCGRAAVVAVVGLFCSTLCPTPAASQTIVLWDAASGKTPDQADLPYTLLDAASPEDPVLDQTGTPTLRLATSTDSETMTYRHSPPSLVVPTNLEILARMRVPTNVSSSSAARAASISFTIAPDFGNTLFIGADEIFLLADFNEKGPGAVVDTDGFHDYLILVDGAGNVTVRHDGATVLTGPSLLDASVNGPTPRIQWGMESTRAHGVTEWQLVAHNAGPAITPAKWNTAFPLQATSGFVNPAVLVGFNPQPEPPGIDLSNALKPVISVTDPSPPAPTVVQLNLAAFGVSAFSAPDVIGNRLEFGLTDGSGERFTLALDVSTSNGDLLDPASLVGFNPQPEPPGSGIYGFNPQPEPPGKGATTGLLFEMGGGGLARATEPETISVAVEILEDESALPISLVPTRMPALGPLGLAATAIALLAGGAGALRWRQHRARWRVLLRQGMPAWLLPRLTIRTSESSVVTVSGHGVNEGSHWEDSP